MTAATPVPPASDPEDAPRRRGADLSRLQIAPDLRAIRLIEGIRGALACALVILLSEWLHDPQLIYVALAAFFTCMSDSGGPIRLRLPRLLTFSVAGAVLWGGLGALRGFGLAPALIVALAAIFCTALSRVWGPAAGMVGNFLSIIIILALDEGLAPKVALEIGSFFFAGGLWATFLALVLWRIYPNRPTRQAVGAVWRALGNLVADLLALSRQPSIAPEEWEAHARAYRRAVRDAIENARLIAIDTVGLRGHISTNGSRALLRLEAGEQLFGALIALSAILEHGDAAVRRDAEQLLRVIRPALTVMLRGMAAEAPVRVPHFERALRAAAERARKNPALERIVPAIIDPLQIVVRLAPHDPAVPDRLGFRELQPGRLAQMWRTLRATLTWRSAIFRHAVRTVVIVAPALALSALWQTPFAHWLPITVVVTLQPFYGATWQRALERIGGTVLGGLVGGGLALTARTPGALAALMVPLSFVAFSSRQVSYGLFIGCVTPLIVVLMELVHPEQSSWEIAGLRALFTVLGGAIAVVGWLAFWPSWEPDRLKAAVRDALRALETFAATVAGERLGEKSATQADGARRLAGVATNNLEASLARAFQEPGANDAKHIETAMVIDATLRRLAGLLSAMRHDGPLHAAVDADQWRLWRAWIGDRLTTLASGATSTLTRPDTPVDALQRVARQIELMENAIARERTTE